ncbi:BRD4-interacting chromatin-remodeling complex-associated protein-like [Elephas maximus indicus]|uniref:BRD4-interacting chromatin-remodeling complex-associated protein-like n=1 Tax=Elephas maximus indicus TaxID=99487 RepID=UPI002117109D|nr:BRD4-interacting chromatin-remodeling complex-associated protein-like [Elephas maximus indicus]
MESDFYPRKSQSSAPPPSLEAVTAASSPITAASSGPRTTVSCPVHLPQQRDQGFSLPQLFPDAPAANCVSPHLPLLLPGAGRPIRAWAPETRGRQQHPRAGPLTQPPRPPLKCPHSGGLIDEPITRAARELAGISLVVELYFRRTSTPWSEEDSGQGGKLKEVLPTPNTNTLSPCKEIRGPPEAPNGVREATPALRPRRGTLLNPNAPARPPPLMEFLAPGLSPPSAPPRHGCPQAGPPVGTLREAHRGGPDTVPSREAVTTGCGAHCAGGSPRRGWRPRARLGARGAQ